MTFTGFWLTATVGQITPATMMRPLAVWFLLFSLWLTSGSHLLVGGSKVSATVHRFVIHHPPVGVNHSDPGILSRFVLDTSSGNQTGLHYLTEWTETDPTEHQHQNQHQEEDAVEEDESIQSDDAESNDYEEYEDEMGANSTDSLAADASSHSYSVLKSTGETATTGHQNSYSTNGHQLGKDLAQFSVFHHKNSIDQQPAATNLLPNFEHALSLANQSEDSEIRFGKKFNHTSGKKSKKSKKLQIVYIKVSWYLRFYKQTPNRTV